MPSARASSPNTGAESPSDGSRTPTTDLMPGITAGCAAAILRN